MAIDLELSPKQKRPAGDPCCEPVVYPDVERAEAERLAAVAKALGDPIRLQLIDVLRKHAGRVCVCELTPLFDVGQSTVSHHLKALRDARAGRLGAARPLGLLLRPARGARGVRRVDRGLAVEGGDLVLRPVTSAADIRDQVRRRYAAAAREARGGPRRVGCGEGGVAAIPQRPLFGSALYGEGERGELPEAAVLASLGCGNPTAVADLAAGEVVLDLGSGGGIDVLLSRAPRRADGEGVRARHDRGDARARTSQRARRRGRRTSSS